ncbi:eukaryotic translation initiation factor 3 subunit A [Ceratobasidium sp. AG-Ba]|nr:eukaryotic translation initiation factor 3 subunit A [Ceratobasidium sp. AG-Ba]
MPPRPKRTRLHPARATTRLQAQAAQAPNKPAPSRAGPSTGVVRPQRTRSNLIMEVVLPASKKPTPKTSSAPTPESFTAPEPSPAEEEETVQEMLLQASSSLSSPPAKESTPRPIPAQDKGKQKMGSLPPSSPPPESSPGLGPAWDRSSRGSTPTPSPSRSRQVSRQVSRQLIPDQPTIATVLVPGTPSSSQHPPTQPTQLQQLPTPTSSPPPFGFASAPKPSTADELRESDQEDEPAPEPQYKPPTSPVPYSDTAAPDDPFGFFAAEDRLKERRAALEREHPAMSYGMPSSGDFDQSTYEEAFGSISHDPQSGTITGTQASATGSDKENVDLDAKQDEGKREATRKRAGKPGGTGPTLARSEKTEREPRKQEEERILTTYELEAMLPRRPKRMRKPRIEEAEKISLSDQDDESDEDDDESPKRRRKVPASRGKAASRGRGGAALRGTRGKGKKQQESKASTDKATAKSVSSSSRRVRSFDTSHLDEETRKRFEAERDRRLKAYKALDNYTLEEEEVVW